MTKPRVRLGMLTPSSNTALEPITSAMLSALPHVSAHFARFTVTEIALSEQALGQFDTSHILSAACQLADARVDVIAWNGTSAGWLGFERDVECAVRSPRATGIPATTSVLALNDIFAKTGVRRWPRLTLHRGDAAADREQLRGTRARVRGRAALRVARQFQFRRGVRDTIVQRDARDGLSRSGCRDHFLYQSARGASGACVQLSIPAYDTVATAVWKSLRIAGNKRTRWQDWGRLFAEVP